MYPFYNFIPSQLRSRLSMWSILFFNKFPKVNFDKVKNIGSLAQTSSLFIILWAFFILFPSTSPWFHYYKIAFDDLQEFIHIHIIAIEGWTPSTER